ncbi:MAG: hypothetical protein ACMXX7_01575 [Candidatus Woesearchaeota archaeon]
MSKKLLFIAIVALVFLSGCLQSDDGNFVADRCVVERPLQCVGQNYMITETHVTVELRNSLSENILLKDLEYKTEKSQEWISCVKNENDKTIISGSSTGRLTCNFEPGAVVAGQRETVEIRYKKCVYYSDDECEVQNEEDILVQTRVLQ